MVEGEGQVQETSHKGRENAQLSSIRQETAQNGESRGELSLVICLVRGESVAEAYRSDNPA